MPAPRRQEQKFMLKMVTSRALGIPVPLSHALETHHSFVPELCFDRTISTTQHEFCTVAFPEFLATASGCGGLGSSLCAMTANNIVATSNGPRMIFEECREDQRHFHVSSAPASRYGQLLC